MTAGMGAHESIGTTGAVAKAISPLRRVKRHIQAQLQIVGIAFLRTYADSSFKFGVQRVAGGEAEGSPGRIVHTSPRRARSQAGLANAYILLRLLASGPEIPHR